MPQETTLYFDTEQSGASYTGLYASEPGVSGPLWPVPIPVVGVSGKIGQGKTTFLLDIAAGPVRRLDVPAEMRKRMDKAGKTSYRPLDTFEWFREIVLSIPPGLFRVIALDVGEEIEQGVSEWVWENPLHFGTTRQQFVKMPAIYHGLVSSFWKSILMDLTSRCETFAFANHVGLVFDSSGKPVPGKEKSKGRPVMKQSASLYINLTREKDAAGNLKEVPAGVVDLSEGGKSRLMTWAVRNGVRQKVPVLPPRMPLATPQAIRDYFVTPPDYGALPAALRAPEKVMTDDDRVAAKTELARQEGETERLRIERIGEERRSAGERAHAAAEPVAEFRSEPTAEQVTMPQAAETVAPPPVAQEIPPPAVAEPAPVLAASATQAAEEERKRPIVSKNIIDYLGGKVSPVTCDFLTTEMYRIAGLDSGQVHAACKRLQTSGKVRIEPIANVWHIGLPTMSFAEPETPTPTEQPETPPLAAAPVATAPPPATQSVNGTPASPPATQSAYKRPACLSPTLDNSVAALWTEFALLQGWSQADKELGWSEAILKRYGCITGRELSQANLAEIEQQLVRNVHNAYVAKGTPLASPFRAEFGDVSVP